MTPQEAIITLKREYLGDSEYMELAKQMGANALEKQIPKKPNYKLEYLMRCCPNCDFPLPLSFKFCNHCGQALDWSDTE